MTGRYRPKETISRSDILELFYPIPEPLRSWEQRERFYNRDLEGLTLPQLLAERARVRGRMLNDTHPWLFERLDAIESAIRRATRPR